ADPRADDELLLREDPVAGPERRAGDGGVAVAEPRLDLMADRARVEEEGRVRVDLVLGAIEIADGEGPVVDEVRVLVDVGRRIQQSSLRGQAESAGGVVVGRVRDEIR